MADWEQHRKSHYSILSAQDLKKKKKKEKVIFKVEFLLNAYGFDYHEDAKLSHSIID